MKNVIIALCLSLAATASYAKSPMDGNWQGPCVAVDTERAKSITENIKFHAHNDTHGVAVFTRTQFLDSKCQNLRFYSIRKLTFDLSKSDLGNGIWNVDGVEMANKENTIFDIVKFVEGEDGFVRAIFGEAPAEKDPAKRPAKLSTRDRIFFKYY